MKTQEVLGKPLGYAQVTDLAAAVGLGTIPAGARVAILHAEGANIRWRDDGTDPTAAIGMWLTTTGDGFTYTGDLSAIKLIEEQATAKLNISFYGKAS